MAILTHFGQRGSANTSLGTSQRVVCATKAKRADWKREIQLLLVYVCIVVIARFTFFPFSKVDGEIQPLVYESAKVYPFRINWIPFVNLFDYPEMRDILRNVIGNTPMPAEITFQWVSNPLYTLGQTIPNGINIAVFPITFIKMSLISG